MTEPDTTPTNNRDEQRAVLIALRGLLETIGSANDAEDHGYIEDAQQMRNDSREAIQSLITQHAFLTELFPQIQSQLDTRRIQIFGWVDLCHGVDATLEGPDTEDNK